MEINTTNMRIAIDRVEHTYQPIFSLVAELYAQGFDVNAGLLQTILDNLKLLTQTIKDDVVA